MADVRMVPTDTAGPADGITASPTGRVVSAYGRHFDVEIPDGEILSCVVKGKKTGVACGDQVRTQRTSAGQGVIVETLPRRSLLYRSDAYRAKVIAANVTQLIIVVAAVPSFYEELLNRCLVAAEFAGIKPLVLLNKSDLISESAPVREALRLYEGLGYEIVTLSAKHAIAPLVPYLDRHVSVLVGQSGMGKSSIINALLPGVRAMTGEISEALDSGRHTTTHARLYRLNEHSDIIDSPGLQEFGLGHIAQDELDHTFPEFRPFLGHCRFHNCRHHREPGCAIQKAHDEGHIDSRRHEAYLKILEKLPHKSPAGR